MIDAKSGRVHTLFIAAATILFKLCVNTHCACRNVNQYMPHCAKSIAPTEVWNSDSCLLNGPITAVVCQQKLRIFCAKSQEFTYRFEHVFMADGHVYRTGRGGGNRL